MEKENTRGIESGKEEDGERGNHRTHITVILLVEEVLVHQPPHPVSLGKGTGSGRGDRGMEADLVTGATEGEEVSW